MSDQESETILDQTKPMIPECISAIIASIPGVLPAFIPGTSIPMALTGLLVSVISQKYQGMTLAAIDERLKRLEKSNTFDRHYLQSDDYKDLMIDILERAGKFNTDRKRMAIASLYESVVGGNMQYEFSEEKYCIDAVSKITSDQIRILRIFEARTTLEGIDSWDSLYHKYLQIEWGEDDLSMTLVTLLDDPRFKTAIEKYAFKYLANQLEMMGLISLGNGLTDYGSRNGTMFSGEHVPASIRLTPLGTIFRRYLQLSPLQSSHKQKENTFNMDGNM